MATNEVRKDVKDSEWIPTTGIPSGKLTWLLKMATEIVDFPIKNGGSFHSYVSLPEGISKVTSKKEPHLAVAHGCSCGEPGKAATNLRRSQKSCGKLNAINLPFGDDRYQPFLVILGMIYSWVYHIRGSYCKMSRKPSLQVNDFTNFHGIYEVRKARSRKLYPTNQTNPHKMPGDRVSWQNGRYQNHQMWVGSAWPTSPSKNLGIKKITNA